MSSVVSLVMHPDRARAQMLVLALPSSLRLYNLTTYRCNNRTRPDLTCYISYPELNGHMPHPLTCDSPQNQDFVCRPVEPRGAVLAASAIFRWQVTWSGLWARSGYGLTLGPCCSITVCGSVGGSDGPGYRLRFWATQAGHSLHSALSGLYPPVLVPPHYLPGNGWRVPIDFAT